MSGPSLSPTAAEASGYLAPAREASAELRDRGSRFLALLSPALDEEACREALAAIARRYPDATHRCFAWRLSQPPRERASDAGEPAGTAGLPILRALRAAGLSDALLVVARWFGGTKLGRGGLARAYAAAAQEAIERADRTRRLPTADLEIEVAMADLGAIKRLLRPGEVELLAESYGERAVLRLRVARARHAALCEALRARGVHLEP